MCLWLMRLNQFYLCKPCSGAKHRSNTLLKLNYWIKQIEWGYRIAHLNYTLCGEGSEKPFFLSLYTLPPQKKPWPTVTQFVAAESWRKLRSGLGLYVIPLALGSLGQRAREPLPKPPWHLISLTFFEGPSKSTCRTYLGHRWRHSPWNHIVDVHCPYRCCESRGWLFLVFTLASGKLGVKSTGHFEQPEGTYSLQVCNLMSHQDFFLSYFHQYFPWTCFFFLFTYFSISSSVFFFFFVD